MSDTGLLESLGLNSGAPSTEISCRPRENNQHLAEICFWFDQGRTQAEIGDIVGVSQPTVSRALARLRPTVDIAVKVLEAQALPAACRVVDLMDSKNDRVALDASKTILGSNKLLGDSNSNITNNIQVVIGGPSLEAVRMQLGVNQPDSVSVVSD